MASTVSENGMDGLPAGEAGDRRRSLAGLSPFVGSAHLYAYFGGPNEKDRIGNCYAFHLFAGGCGTMTVNGKSCRIEPGSLVFVRPGVVHSFHAAPDNRLTCYNIYADLLSGPGIGTVSSSPQFAFPLSDSPGRLTAAADPRCAELDALPVHSSLRSRPQLQEAYIALVQCANRDAGYARTAAGLLFQAWLLQWHDALHSGPDEDAVIGRLLLELEELTDFSQVTTDLLVSRCGIGRTSFFRRFRQMTGDSPGGHLLRLKMKKAALLLLESGHSVTEIAESLGYPSIHYFSRQFKRYYGISPSLYPAQARPT